MKNVFFKIGAIIVVLICSNQLTAQFEAETLDLTYEPGHLFVATKIPELAFKDSIRTRLKAEVKGYYLVFLPPIYKTRKKTMAFPVSEAYKNIDTLQDSIDVIWMYEYLEGYTEPYISAKFIDRNCLSADDDAVVNIEFKEVRPFQRRLYEKISRTDYENGLVDTVYYEFVYHYIDTPYRIIKTPYFNAADYENMDYLKLIYLKGFNWSDFRMVMCHSDGIGYVIAIEMALFDAGYEIKVDGFFDAKTRSALVEFQKEHGLGQGLLDKATLELLGLENYSIDNKYQYYRFKDSPIGPNYKDINH